MREMRAGGSDENRNIRGDDRRYRTDISFKRFIFFTDIKNKALYYYYLSMFYDVNESVIYLISLYIFLKKICKVV